MLHEGKTFKDCRVQLDDNKFEGCTFDKVQLVYSGGQPPSMVRCKFNNPNLVFEGPAERTLAFLQVMSRASSGFRPLIVGSFPDLFAGE